MTISRQAVLDKIDSIAQDATVQAQLDITLSALATALAGVTPKTQAEIWTRLDEIRTELQGTLAVAGTVGVSSSVLPTGAATAAKQDTAKGVLDDIKDGIDDLNVGVSASLVGSATLEIGNVIVVTAETRVQLNADQACNQIIITAEKTNSGKIYVGDDTVSSIVYGVVLEAGEQITLPVANVNMVYIDADLDGEGVSYIAT